MFNFYSKWPRFYATLVAMAVGCATQTGWAAELNYCENDGTNGIQMRKDSVKASPEIEKQFLEWVNAAKQMHIEVREMLNRSLREPVLPQELGRVSQSAMSRLPRLKQELEILLSRLPKPFRQEGQGILRLYFSLATKLIELGQLEYPSRFGLAEVTQPFQILLSPAVLEHYSAAGQLTLANIEVEALNRENKLIYRLSPSREAAYRSLVRASARSQAGRGMEVAYVDTVRCILTRAILGKLGLNQVLVGQNFSSPLKANDFACLGAKAEDVMALTSHDLNTAKESQLRTLFLKGLPNYTAGLSPQSAAFLLKIGSLSYVGNLLAYPKLLYIINENRNKKGLEPFSHEDLAATRQNVGVAIEQAYSKTPGFQNFRSVWKSDALESRLKSIFSNCKISISGSNDTSNSLSDLLINLTTTDDFTFLSMLRSNISNLPAEWLLMDSQQLSLAIKNYILATKVESSLSSLFYLIDYLASAESAGSNELILAMGEEFGNLLYKELNSIWEKTPELKNWLKTTTDSLQKEKQSTAGFDAMLSAYLGELSRVALKVRDVLDPKLSVQDLPYDQSAVLRALEASIQKFSPQNRRRYNILTNESNPSVRYELWKKISSQLEQEALALGTQCREPNRLDSISNRVATWFGSQSATKRLTIERDCVIFQLVANMIGAVRSSAPQNISNGLYYLSTATDPATAKEFEQNYRRILSEDLMSENRILALPIIPSNEKLWQKFVQVENPQDLKNDVKAALQKSIFNLEAHLKTVSTAKRPQDLAFFIQRTSAINAILGANVMAKASELLNPLQTGEELSDVLSSEEHGFVFPTLLGFHQKLQSQMNQDEEMRHETWDEFVNTNTNVAMLVLGGWVLKHAFGWMPRLTGLPAVSNLIGVAGYRTWPLISAHSDLLLGLFGAHLFVLGSQRWNLNSELTNLEAAYFEDGAALKIEGAQFPILENSDFYRQKAYFENALTQNKNDLIQTATFTVLPFVIGRGAQTASNVVNKQRLLKENSFKTASPLEKQKFEISIINRVKRQRSQLEREFALIGRPQSLDASILRSYYEQALRRTTSARERAIVNEAYERILTTFGRPLEGYAKMPELQYVYARALFGNGANTQQLHLFYSEFERFMKIRGGP